MGLGGKQDNLAKQLEAAEAKGTELEGQKAAAEERATKAEADAKELAGQKAAAEERATKAEADAKELAGQKAAAEERATKAEARVKDLEAQLKNPAAVHGDAVPGRKKPVAEGGAADAGAPEITWAEARKQCGGSYSEARRKFPAAFAAAFPGIAAKQAVEDARAEGGAK